MSRTFWPACGVAVCCCSAWASPTVTEPEPAAEAIVFDRQVYATGLQSPDGLALHPASGELYVTEETAGRISVIRAGHAVPVAGPVLRVNPDLPDWLMTADKPAAFWQNGKLSSPEGIAFGSDGTLYVVEDTPRGRVLSFTPSAAGAYGNATVLPVPHLGEAYAWESIALARDGRVFLAGASHEAQTGWSSSCVLSRDTTQGWWMVDHGPFASFSALALSSEEEVLVAGDEALGGITWWDVNRQQEIQTLSQELGAIEGLAVLPDGSLVVAQENVVVPESPQKSGGRLLRIDPASGTRTIIAEGLGSLESVVCDERTGRLYVSEDSTGRILCFTPRQPLPRRQELLQVVRRSGEARRGLPPRQTPDFLKHFMKKVGVELVDQGQAGGAATGARGQGSLAEGIPPLTLEELGQRIPLVAGRVQVEELEGVEDPITEISFINLFPNQMTRTDNRSAPSLCLFSAKHRSGKVDRSQILGGFQARKLSPDGATEMLNAEALLMLPLATCSAVESDNGVTVAMTFLGLDRFEDCFLTLNYGRRNEAYFSVAGPQLRVARARFAETRVDGREVVNFAMTGVRPRRAEDATWMRISTQPGWSLLSPSLETWVSRWSLAHMPELVNQMRRFNRDALDALLAADEEEARAEMARRRSAPSKEQQKSESATTGESAPNRASVPAPSLHPPLAHLAFPPLVPDEDQLLTNLILSRIVQAWQDGSTQ
jgi:sugar lactone lactonase YvrE